MVAGLLCAPGSPAAELLVIRQHAPIDDKRPKWQQGCHKYQCSPVEPPTRHKHRAQQSEAESDEQPPVNPSHDSHRRGHAGKILQWHGYTEKDEEGDGFDLSSESEKRDGTFHGEVGSSGAPNQHPVKRMVKLWQSKPRLFRREITFPSAGSRSGSQVPAPGDRARGVCPSCRKARSRESTAPQISG
jgi:hypothetical protein